MSTAKFQILTRDAVCTLASLLFYTWLLYFIFMQGFFQSEINLLYEDIRHSILIVASALMLVCSVASHKLQFLPRGCLVIAMTLASLGTALFTAAHLFSSTVLVWIAAATTCLGFSLLPLVYCDLTDRINSRLRAFIYNFIGLFWAAPLIIALRDVPYLASQVVLILAPLVAILGLNFATKETQSAQGDSMPIQRGEHLLRTVQVVILAFCAGAVMSDVIFGSHPKEPVSLAGLSPLFFPSLILFFAFSLRNATRLRTSTRLFFGGGLVIFLASGLFYESLIATNFAEIDVWLKSYAMMLVAVAVLIEYVFLFAKSNAENPSEAVGLELPPEINADILKDTCNLVSERYGLTQREHEILLLFAQGRNVPYIKNKLSLAEGTIRTYTSRIYQKTGVHTRQELIDLIIEGNPTVPESRASQKD